MIVELPSIWSSRFILSPRLWYFKSVIDWSDLMENHITKHMNLVPSLPRPIPHSEHPIAYRNQTVYRVKFLHHLQLPPQTWSSSKRTTTGSSATPSEHGFSTPSNYESPYTPPSSCMSSPINLGSPQLPASSIKVIEEGELPIFDFRLKEGKFM